MGKVRLRKEDVRTVIPLLERLPLSPQEGEKHLLHGEICGPSGSGGPVPQSGRVFQQLSQGTGKSSILPRGGLRSRSLQDKSRVGQCFSLGITELVSWGRDRVFVNQFTA